jgi:hypothetical protein
MDIEAMRRIAKGAVNPDGSIKSFEEQLINYNLGHMSRREKFLLAESTSKLGVPAPEGKGDRPLIMEQNVIRKAEEKHFLPRERLIELESWIKEHVLAFDSLTVPSSIVMITDELDHGGNEIIIPVHYDSRRNAVAVNTITSVYGRRNLEGMMERAFGGDGRFYVNGNTKEWLAKSGLQLPRGLTTLLKEKCNTLFAQRKLPFVLYRTPGGALGITDLERKIEHGAIFGADIPFGSGWKDAYRFEAPWQGSAGPTVCTKAEALSEWCEGEFPEAADVFNLIVFAEDEELMAERLDAAGVMDEDTRAAVRDMYVEWEQYGVPGNRRTVQETNNAVRQASLDSEVAEALGADRQLPLPFALRLTPSAVVEVRGLGDKGTRHGAIIPGGSHLGGVPNGYRFDPSSAKVVGHCGTADMDSQGEVLLEWCRLYYPGSLPALEAVIEAGTPETLMDGMGIVDEATRKVLGIMNREHKQSKGTKAPTLDGEREDARSAVRRSAGDMQARLAPARQ